MRSIRGGTLGWNIEIYSTPTNQFDWSVSRAYVINIYIYTDTNPITLPCSLARAGKNREKSETTSQEENTLATAVLPYVKNLSEEVRRILRDYGIRTAFKNYTTLGSILTKVKDQMERRNGVIYKINCACGDTYIGETGRTLEIRMKEHKRACVRADFEKSAVAEHAWLSGHYIDWDNVEVLDQENELCRRKVKEGIEIRLTNKKLNIS